MLIPRKIICLFQKDRGRLSLVKKFRPVFTTEALVFAAALMITLPLRTVQYYTNIEAGNGFYKSVDAITIIYAAVLAACSVFFIVSGIKKRKKVSLETRAQRLPACGVFAFLSVFAVLYSVYTDYMMKDRDASEFVVSSTASSAVSGYLTIIQAVIGVIAAAYFLFLAITFLMGKSSSLLKLTSLSVPIWMILRLIMRFTHTISYLRVSDLALEMISLVFFASFFMAFVQTNSGVEADGNEWKITGFGFTAALFALNLFVPRLALVITGRSESMYILSNADFSDLTLSLFIIATILTRMVPDITKVEVKGTDVEETAV